MRWLLAALCLSFQGATRQAPVVITVNGKPVDKNQVLKPAPSSQPVRAGQTIDKVLVIKSARKLELISNGSLSRIYRISWANNPGAQKCAKGTNAHPKASTGSTGAKKRQVQSGDAHQLPQYQRRGHRPAKASTRVR